MRTGESPVELTARLTEARADLEAVQALIDGAPTNPGCSKLRGKQHGIRVDAAIRTVAGAVERAARLDREIASLRTRIAEAGRETVDPGDLRGAKVVQDRHGVWHEVVRVNRTTVSVKTGYSWVDRIPHDMIVAAR